MPAKHVGSGGGESVLDIRWVGTEWWVRFCRSWLLAHVCQSEHRLSTSTGTGHYGCWWLPLADFRLPPFPVDLSFAFQDSVKPHHILPEEDLWFGHYMFPQRLIIEAWSLIGDPSHCEAVMKALIHWVRHNLMVWYRGDGDFERWGLDVGRRSLGHDLGASFTYWILWGEWMPHPLHHEDLPYHKLKAAKPAGHKLQPLRPWAKVSCSSSLSLAFSVPVLKIWRQRLLELFLDIGIRPSLVVLLVKLLNSEWSFYQHCMVAALLVFIVGSVFHLWAIPMRQEILSVSFPRPRELMCRK